MSAETTTGLTGLSEQALLPVLVRIQSEPISTLETGATEQIAGMPNRVSSAPSESGLKVLYLDAMMPYLLSIETANRTEGTYFASSGVSQHSFDVSLSEGMPVLYGTIYGSALATNPHRFLEYTFQSSSATGYTASEAASNVSPVRQEAAAAAMLFWGIKNQLDFLPKSDDIETKPTDFAHSQAQRLVVSVYTSIASDKRLKRPPPTPVIGTDDSGGIMVSWTSAKKYLAVNFGAQPESRSFLYFEEGAAHGAIALSERNLLEKLKWLSER